MALACCQLLRLAVDPREQSLPPPLRLCLSPPLRLSHGTGTLRWEHSDSPPLRLAADPREQSLWPPQRSLPRMLLGQRLLLLLLRSASPEGELILSLTRLPPSPLLAHHLPILLLDAQRPGTHTSKRPPPTKDKSGCLMLSSREQSLSPPLLLAAAVLGAARCPRVSSLRLFVWLGKGGSVASD